MTYETLDKDLEYITKESVYIVVKKDDKLEILKIQKTSEIKSLLETIIEKTAKKKQPESTIDRLVKDYWTQQRYDNKTIDDYLQATNNKVINEVPDLGPGILGMYDSATDTVYVLSNLSAHEKAWVIEHELEHRYRHFHGMSQDEAEVDRAASTKLGYDPFNRFNN